MSAAAKENQLPAFSATTQSQKLSRVLRTLPSTLEESTTQMESFSSNHKKTQQVLRSGLAALSSNFPTPKSQTAANLAKKTRNLQLSIGNQSSTHSATNSNSSKSQKRRNMNTIQFSQTIQPNTTSSSNSRLLARRPNSSNKSNTQGLFRSKNFDQAKPSPKVYITITSPKPQFGQVEQENVCANQILKHDSLVLDETLQLSNQSLHKPQESSRSQTSNFQVSNESKSNSKSHNVSQRSLKNRSYQNVSLEEAQAFHHLKQATQTQTNQQFDSSNLSGIRQKSGLPVPETHPLLQNKLVYDSKNQLQDTIGVNQSSELPKFDYKQFIIRRNSISEVNSNKTSSRNTTRSQALASGRHQSHRSSQHTTLEDSNESLTQGDPRLLNSLNASNPYSGFVVENQNFKSTEIVKKKSKKSKGTIAQFINKALQRQQRRSTSLSNPVLKSNSKRPSSVVSNKSSTGKSVGSKNLVPQQSARSKSVTIEQNDSQESELSQEENEEQEEAYDHHGLEKPDDLLSDVEIVPHEHLVSQRSSRRHAEVQYLHENMVSITISSQRSYPKPQNEVSEYHSKQSEPTNNSQSARVPNHASLNLAKYAQEEMSLTQKKTDYGIVSPKGTISPQSSLHSPVSRNSGNVCSNFRAKNSRSVTSQKSVKSKRTGSHLSIKKSTEKKVSKQSVSSKEQKQSVDLSLTHSSHFGANERSKKSDDETLLQLLKHQLQIVAAKIEFYCNFVTIDGIRSFSCLETPPSTAFVKAGRCFALLLKSFTSMDSSFRQIKDEETFSKWERIQQYLNSQQGELQMSRLHEFVPFCETHLHLVDKETLCSVLRREIFSYTLVQIDDAQQVEIDLESPRVKNPPVKPYFCVAYFMMTYVTLLEMHNKQAKKIADSSIEIFKQESLYKMSTTVTEAHRESSKSSSVPRKKAHKRSKQPRGKSLTTQKTNGSGLSNSQTTLSVKQTNLSSSSVKCKSTIRHGNLRKQKEYSRNLVVRAIQQELNTTKKVEKKSKKEKISTTVKKIKTKSLSPNSNGRTPPSVIRQRPQSRNQLARDSSNEAYSNLEQNRTSAVRHAILNADQESDAPKNTPKIQVAQCVQLENKNESSLATSMDMFSSHIKLHSSETKKHQQLNVVAQNSLKSEEFYQEMDESHTITTESDSQIVKTISVGVEHALIKAESSRQSISQQPIKQQSEFTFQSQGSYWKNKNEKVDAVLMPQNDSFTPDHNARVSDFLALTINSCAKKGAPIRVDDLIKKIKFECDSQDHTSRKEQTSYSKTQPNSTLSEKEQSKTSNQIQIQIPLVKYVAQSVNSNSDHQLSDFCLQQVFDDDESHRGQKVNLLATQECIENDFGLPTVTITEIASKESLLPLNNVFEELKELAEDKASGRIEEFAGSGLVAQERSQLEQAFEDFYRQKSTSRADSDSESLNQSQNVLEKSSSMEQVQAKIASRSSGKYESLAKSICDDIQIDDLQSEVAEFAISPEKKDIQYKRNRTPAQIVNSLKKRARARSHGKRLFEATIKNKTSQIVSNLKEFVKQTDPNVVCFGDQPADFEYVSNSIQKNNLTSVQKGSKSKDDVVNSIVKKFAFASSRKEGSPDSVCKFEQTEPNYKEIVNKFTKTQNFTLKDQSLGKEIEFNLTGLQKLSEQLTAEDADAEQGTQMRTFSLSDYTSEFAKTYSSTQMITEKIFARINEFKKQRNMLLEH